MPDPHWPALPLPDLKPGEQPPEKCPCCGADVAWRATNRAKYKCGAEYDGSHDPAATASPRFDCPRPSAEAVVKAMGLVASLRAILAGLTPEQRNAPTPLAKGPHEGDEVDVDECLEAAADALSKP